MHDDIHQNDIGTVFRINLVDNGDPVDLTGQTLLEIRFKKPSGTVVVQDADIPSGGETLGQLEYVTQAAASGATEDLDEVGLWELRAKITLPTGTWTSEKDQFKVNEIF